MYLIEYLVNVCPANKYLIAKIVTKAVVYLVMMVKLHFRANVLLLLNECFDIYSFFCFNKTIKKNYNYTFRVKYLKMEKKKFEDMRKVLEDHNYEVMKSIGKGAFG